MDIATHMKYPQIDLAQVHSAIKKRWNGKIE